MTPALPLCGLVLLLDAGLFSLMLDVRPSVGEMVVFLVAHAAACLLFSLALHKLLPDPYRASAAASYLLVFTTIAFIPVLGMIGFLACIIPSLRHQRLAPQLGGWTHSRVLGLPLQPARPRGMAGLASGCELAGPLQHAADPKQRTAALIATLSLNDQEATPLLRLALKDPEDDVRLLAYALLNRKEKSIEARIRYRNAQLGSCVPEQVFSQHKALAHDYWALAHLGAPQGSTLLLLCARAHEHVQAALQLRPRDGGLQFLLGRILIIEMKLDAATEAFEKARQSGVDRRQIEPFLAEISFLTRQYFAVNNHLAQAGSGVHRLRLDKVATYWERPSHDAIQT